MNETRTRREILSAMAAVPLVAAAKALDAQTKQPPQPPSHVQVTDAPTGERVLTPADLSFDGFIRFPGDFSDLWYNYGQLAQRVVNGKTRIFTCGNAPTFNILEYELTDDAPSLIISTTGTTTRPIRDWGPIPLSVSITGGAWNQWVMGALWWDEKRQLLWCTYGDSYAPVEHAPSIFCARLNNDGTVTFFGPWRTQLHSFKTCGAIVPLPQDFADTYLGAKGRQMLAVSGGPHNKDSYFGPGLAALNLDVFGKPGVPFDPFTTPADVSVLPTDNPYPHITLGCTPLIGHDILDDVDTKRMKRTTRYQQCRWLERYDSNKGTEVIDGTPLFNGRSDWLGNSDQDSAHPPLVIKTSTGKVGVLFLGQMADTPDDYTPPGGGLGHIWYGATTDTVPGATRLERYCCHQQSDPYWDATGPGAHIRLAKGWFYRLSDLGRVARGEVLPHQLTPTTNEYSMGLIIPRLAALDAYEAARGIVPPKMQLQRIPPGFFRGAVWDEANSRVLVVLNQSDWTLAGKPRPVMLSIKVKP